jgi:hypothetical protein
MPPDEPTDEERMQELAQDQQTPFQPADPNPSPVGNTTDPQAASGDAGIPVDHPTTDANIDSTELYDEGVSGAAEVEDRSAQSSVVDYNPDEDDEE